MRAENHPLFPLVVVADCWLQRLLVWTPGQTDLIKTVALLLMVADHISMLCGLDNDWLRLAGRGAFPLFGLVWAMNLARHPRIQQRALNRLWGWAVVAQGGWILAGLRAWPLSLMLVLAWLPFSAGSYGLAGVVMLMLACGVCMTGRRTTRMGLALCLALAILALNVADSAAFAIAGLVIPGITLTVLSRTCTLVPRFWPREFFPLFYAVHLAVIGLMVM